MLGGCFFPATVQVASLIADGISLVTTDKTLTDHGLSAITSKDCAVWRVVNGEDVCRDIAPDEGPVLVENLSPPAAPNAALVDTDDVNFVRTPEIEVASVAPINATEALAAPQPIAIVAPLPVLPAPIAKIAGGTFYVIASFSNINGAKRFARQNAALTPQVLTGTARGKTVYRVATGPVDKASRPAIRAKLADGSFNDAWALTLTAPKLVELASLD